MAQPRKRPWYARLPQHLGSAVKVRAYAAQNPDGFLRQVDITVQIPEPGRGGTNPPMRDVVIRMNPRDAQALARKLNTRAEDALGKNAQFNDGGDYTGDYADLWSPERTPRPFFTPTRRVPRVGAQGHLYGLGGDSVEAQVLSVSDTHVTFRFDGDKGKSLPRTDADLAAFHTADDNWETL